MGVSVAHATPISEKLIFIYTNIISYKNNEKIAIDLINGLDHINNISMTFI